MTISPYVKFTYKQYFALGKYLTEKYDDEEMYDMLVEILECFELNLFIDKDIDREKKYPKRTKQRIFAITEDDKTYRKTEEELYNEFRERYIVLKNKLGKDGITVAHSELTLKKSFLAQYINLEDINTHLLPDTVKKKLYATLVEKERIEKYIYKKILNEFKHDKIVKQYVVEHYYGKYKIDFYFVDCKVAVEIDEWGHQGYYGDKERQSYIEKNLGCVFVRYNPFGGTESVDKFLKKLKRVVELQKRKYKYSFTEDSLRKLDEMAMINNCSVDKIIKNIINEAYSKMIEENKKNKSSTN